jgi:hypothetical protein
LDQSEIVVPGHKIVIGENCSNIRDAQLGKQPIVVAKQRLQLVEPIGGGQVLRQMLKEVPVVRPTRPARWRRDPVGIDKGSVPLRQRRDIQTQKIVLQIVERYTAPVIVKGQKSSAVQATEHIPRGIGLHVGGIAPQGADHRDRNVGVFRENSQLEVAVVLRFSQRVGAEPQ